MSKTATKPVTNHQSDEPVNTSTMTKEERAKIIDNAGFLFKCCRHCKREVFNYFQEIITMEELNVTNEKFAFLPEHCQSCRDCSQKIFDCLEMVSQKKQTKIKESFTFLIKHYQEGNQKIFDCINYLEKVLLIQDKALELLDLDENTYYTVIREIALELIFRSEKDGINSLNKNELAFIKKAEKIFDFSLNPPLYLENLNPITNFSSQKLPEDTSFNFFLRKFPKKYSLEINTPSSLDGDSLGDRVDNFIETQKILADILI